MKRVALGLAAGMGWVSAWAAGPKHPIEMDYPKSGEAIAAALSSACVVLADRRGADILREVDEVLK